MLGESWDAYGYGNPVLTVSLTGAQLDAVLEQQWQTQTNGTVKFAPARPVRQRHLRLRREPPGRRPHRPRRRQDRRHRPRPGQDLPRRRPRLHRHRRRRLLGLQVLHRPGPQQHRPRNLRGVPEGPQDPDAGTARPRDAEGLTRHSRGVVLAFGGDLEFDPALFEVRRGGVPVPLEPQAFDVLAYLVSHRDRVVPKEELMDGVWGGRFVSETAVTSRIKQVRRALGDDGHSQRMIKTLHGRGYRFVAPVEARSEQSPGHRADPLHRQRRPPHRLPGDRWWSSSTSC